MQVTLKESVMRAEFKNLNELEDVINNQAAKGYRLHTLSTTASPIVNSDRIQATMVFEKL